MAKLDSLSALLAERLSGVARELLTLVEDVVSEFRAESARLQKENDNLKRQLRELFFIDDETDMFDAACPSPGLEQSSLEQEDTLITINLQCLDGGITDGELSIERPEGDGSGAEQIFMPGEESDGHYRCSSSDNQDQSEKEVKKKRQSLIWNPVQSDSSDDSHSDPVSDHSGHKDSAMNEAPKPAKGKRGGGKQKRKKAEKANNRHIGGPHQCSKCNMSFSELKYLKSHHRLVHSKVMGCNICGKAFAQTVDLQRHLLTHSGERPHRCDQCPRSFAQLGNLRKHQQTHESKKQYKCPHCSMSFSDPDALGQHDCGKDKPFSCNICQQSFSAAKGLQAHLRKTHPKVQTLGSKGKRSKKSTLD